MLPDPSEARLTVDLDALAANHAFLKSQAGAAEVAPVVKADAYGLGLAPVARRLWAEGARTFFVARLAEGERLREALSPEAPTIYVLDGCPPGAAERLAAADLVPVLNSLPQLEAWATAASRRRLPAALHVDTGMNRLGLRPEEVAALVAAPDRLGGLDVGLVMSHLACAEVPEHPLNRAQLEAFRKAAAHFPHARKSLANSAGIFLGEDYRFDMVRPGISLYGGGPLGRPDSRLRAVATLEAPILQVCAVGSGETVGYGAAYTAETPGRIAVLAAGYADGVLRSQSPGGYGWTGGMSHPFRGRISMDLIAMDLSGRPDAKAGDLVELLGADALLDEQAAAGGTVAYELLVRIGARARRTYVGEASWTRR